MYWDGWGCKTGGAQMKINWKVRIKNPLWWVQIAAALVLPMLAYFGLA